MEFEKSRNENLVKRLAKSIDLCNNFSDIQVVNDPNMPSMAGVNAQTNTLVINTGNSFLTFEELLESVEGLVTHETGHGDFRLGSPADYETFQLHKKEIKRKKLGDKGMMWLNIVYDFEIHRAYLQKGFVKLKYQRKLRDFLTLSRSKLFKKNHKDIMLSMEYPTTKEQKMVKKVIENRNLDVISKVSKLARSRKLNKPQQKGKSKQKAQAGKIPPKTPLTEMLDPNNAKGKKKRKAPISIKEDIDEEHRKAEIRKKLSSMGLSLDEIDSVLQRYPNSQLVKHIEWLEKSMNNILPNLEYQTSKDKTKEKSKDRGSRINGYTRMRDITDVTRNIEDFATVGEYDINEVRIPYKIDRKCKGNIIIVRDVSGSVSGEPMATMVRDITVNLIEIAKKKQHKVAVIDFHSKVEPITDDRGELLTSKYTPLLIDSMKLKAGYTTRLDKVFDFINEEIVEKHKEVPLNIFIVTDGYVGEVKQRIKGKKVNLAGILIDEDDDIHDSFSQSIERNNGKIYRVTKKNEKHIVSELVRDFVK